MLLLYNNEKRLARDSFLSKANLQCLKKNLYHIFFAKSSPTVSQVGELFLVLGLCALPDGCGVNNTLESWYPDAHNSALKTTKKNEIQSANKITLLSAWIYSVFFHHYVPQTFQILTAWSTHTHTHAHAPLRYKKWLHLHLSVWLSSKWRLGDLWSICSDRCFSLHSQIWKQLFFFLKTYTYIHKETDISTQYPHCSPQGYMLQCFNWEK